MKPLIAITLPNHWSIKNLFHSGLVARLQHDARIQCWTSPSRFEGLQSLSASLGLEAIDWQVTPTVEENRAQTLVRHFQKSALLEHHRVKTEQIVMHAARGKRSNTQRALSKVVRAIAQSKAGAPTVAALEVVRRQTLPRFPDLPGERPSLIFTTNPVDFREDPWVEYARRIGVPVASFVPSWDNITSKGVLRPDFDRLMVWSETMREEVRTMYPRYALKQVPVVGLPRFDVYFQELPSEFQRRAFLSALGLNPDFRTLLYANTATRSFPQQPQVVAHIAELLLKEGMERVQLFVRAHPHDDLRLYEHLRRCERVAIWPTVEGFDAAFGVQDCPPANDLLVLAAMIRHADVVINTASTIALDAAVADRPIVSVAYDGDEDLPYRHSVRNAYDYSHQRPFVESGAAPIMKTRAQLEDGIREALANPGARQEQRQHLARLATQGDSVNRMTDVLLSLLGGGR